jgi:Tol biopolymer transport system component
MRTLAAVALALGVLVGVGPQEVRASRVAARQPWLLFESTRTGRSEIYAVPRSGGRLVQVTFRGGSWPRPSPNGRWILVDRSGGTWITAADGRGAKLLFRGGSDAAWALDSRRIAYVRAAGGIWVASRDGSGKRAVTKNRADRNPRWSPDGRAIAFLDGDTLTVVQSGRRTTLAPDVISFAWSPDGRRIAFRSGSMLELVGADGRGRRTLIAYLPTDGSSSAPAWSPGGKLVAYAGQSLYVVTVASGRMQTLPLASSASEVAWTPRGDALAFVKAGSEIRLGRIVTDDSPPSDVLLHTEDALVAGPFRIVWTTPPRGVSYRKPAPAKQPFVAASADDLKAKAPINELAADGRRVAFLACKEVGAWTAGSSAVIEVRQQRPLCVERLDQSRLVVGGVTVAGDYVGYETVSGSSLIQGSLEVVGPGGQASIAAAPITAGSGPGIGFMLGHGSLLVFSTWRPASACYGTLLPCPDPRRQPLWRSPLPVTGICVRDAATGDVGPPCRKIAGPVAPLAVDETRIVVRRADGWLAVLEGDGRELLALPFAPGEIAGAEIAGTDLVVVVPGLLRHYDAATGTLLHTWPLPQAAPGSACWIPLWWCDAPRLLLEDAARGLAAYILDGRLHLLRLLDGADVVVGYATAAQLEDEGLFYAYYGASPYTGRIRFVPFDRLPLQ